ncbi:GNAT family N-acetyltransferase, partial [Bacillus thuringiensis]
MQSKLITELTDLETAFHIRKEVFVKEQGVPLADEFDIFDEIGEQCKHILVYYHEFPVGTGRIRFVDGVGKLERICILKDYRTYGLGKVIIQTLEEIARNEQVTKVKLHGQTQAEGFY